MTIGVNAKQSPARRRFTIAHEFGHFLLHEGFPAMSITTTASIFARMRSSLAVDIEEIEANFFAACLLMPKQFLIAVDAIEALDSDRAVGRLATAFKVSRHAMSLRLATFIVRIRPTEHQHSPL